ncbi:GFA family protein [Pseudomonas sp. dw_358]|uniref:GFA family protein n=1 Tax=Pseudomonas sp. dw_358 TaxID=2720083 RepID=UPI001BD3A2C1|nr:GFA family protein [Pseudomonas sp. dw_358]
MLNGQCLCGAVMFSLAQAPATFYRCHCSLCRRQTGTGHNCATIVAQAQFQWTAGQSEIGSWQKPSGYRNDFCRQCGSTVPNALRGTAFVWVPLGLLDDVGGMTCVGDFSLNDAMPWDTVRGRHGFDRPVQSLEGLLGLILTTPGSDARNGVCPDREGESI